jgi:hypothetical protein
MRTVDAVSHSFIAWLNNNSKIPLYPQSDCKTECSIVVRQKELFEKSRSA